MSRRYPLHRRTRHILASVEKEFGFPVPILDAFVLVSDLDEKVRRTFEPAEIERIEMLDSPVHAGNCDFYALSLFAEDWYDEFCEAFPDAPKMHEAGWLYASAHSLKSDVLKKAYSDKTDLALEVFKWRASCGVKPGQVDAIRRLLNPPIPWPKADASDEANEKRGYGGDGWMVAELCKIRQDPTFWREGCPMLRAMQDYRNCTLYAESDPETRHARWERWQTAACVDEQKAVRALRSFMAERKEQISADTKAEGTCPQAAPAHEAVSAPEIERGEKSATENGAASILPTMAQKWPQEAEAGTGANDGAGRATGDPEANGWQA